MPVCTLLVKYGNASIFKLILIWGVYLKVLCLDFHKRGSSKSTIRKVTSVLPKVFFPDTDMSLWLTMSSALLLQQLVNKS